MAELWRQGGYLIQHLRQPVGQALVGQFILTGLVERQADKIATAIDQRHGGVELIAFVWPVTHQLASLDQQLVMQKSHGIEEPFAVASLIAEAEQGDDFTLQIKRIQGIPAG